MEAKTGFEVLQETVSVFEDRKVAKKALTEVEKAISGLTEQDPGFVKIATKLVEKKGAGWAGSPLALDKEAKVKDPLSQMFIGMRDKIVSLRQTGQAKILTDYFSALEGSGIHITVDPVDLPFDDAVDEMFSRATSFIRTIRSYDDEVKDEHAPKAEELNFCPAKEYKGLAKIYQRGMKKGPEAIDDACQDKVTYCEMTETAYNLVHDSIRSEEGED